MERAIRDIAAIKSLPDRNELIQKLQGEVYALQRYKKVKADIPQLGLGPIIHAFPQDTFPIGAVHEFISHTSENAAATTGFMTALAGRLMQQHGTCLWVSSRRTVFPASLKQFGIDATRIIFIDLIRQKDVLWAVEEALKCQSLSLVVGEASEISFNDSRRLQLAVEQSNVTGLIHRHKPRTENTLACVARWKITSLTSSPHEALPGVGRAHWQVALTKVRNGKPGIWDIEWSNKGFRYMQEENHQTQQVQKRKTA
jgi:protein ImuA